MVLENWTQVDLVVNGGVELISSAGVTLAKQWFWCKYPDLELEFFFFNQDKEAPSHRMCFLIDTYQ